MINDKDKVAVHRVARVEGTETSLYTDTGGRRCIRVRVMGVRRPDLGASSSIVEAGKFTMAELVHRVETMAGACAEHLAERHGEPLDPHECARRGVAAVRALLDQS